MKKILLLAILFILSTTLNMPAWAAFEHQIFGVRPMGMGGAFTAVCNDSNALLWNPAGMVLMDRKEVTLMDSRDYKLTYGPELKSNFAGLVVPLTTAGALGFSYTSFGNKDVLSEKAGALSYAFEPRAMVSLGLTVKRLSLVPNADIVNDPAIKQYDSFGTDLGILFNPRGKLKFGAMVRNLGADLGDKQDNVRPDYTLGVSFQPWNRLTTAVDLVTKKDIGGSAGKSWKMTGGVEYLMGDYVSIRGGYANNAICAGLGFRQERAQLDYAFFRHDIGDTHRASLTFRFGKEHSKKRLSEPIETPEISRFPTNKSDQAFERLEQEQADHGKLEALDQLKTPAAEELEQQVDGYKRQALGEPRHMIEAEDKLRAAEGLLKAGLKTEIDEDSARMIMDAELSPDGRKVMTEKIEDVSTAGDKAKIEQLKAQKLQEMKEAASAEVSKKPASKPQKAKSVEERFQELKREKLQPLIPNKQSEKNVKKRLEELKKQKLAQPQSARPKTGFKKGFTIDLSALDKRFLYKNSQGAIFMDLRVFRDSLGMAQREFKSGQIILENEYGTISLKLGIKNVEVNGEKKALSTMPHIRNHAIFIPVKDMVEIVNAKVKLPDWLSY